MIDVIKNTLFTPLGSAAGPLGIKMLLDGLVVTIYVTIVSGVIGLILGLITAIMQLSKNKILKYTARVYVEIIRGTPVVVQLTIIYFIVFSSVAIDRSVVAFIAFGINSGAYVSEIIRAGIQAVDKGQMEAARSLGMPNKMAMQEIVLPQALRNILPTLANEFIVLIKETSIMGFIGGMDLMRAGDKIRSITYQATVPLISAAVIYLIIILVLSYLLTSLAHIFCLYLMFFSSFPSAYTQKGLCLARESAISNKDKYSSNPTRHCIIHHTGI